MKKKYGAPNFDDASATGRGSYYWYLDKDGNPYPVSKLTSCRWAETKAFDSLAPQVFNIISNYISRGVPDSMSPAGDQAAKEAASPACGYTAGLRIYVNADNQGRVANITMEAQNFKLGWSSIEATRQKLIDAQTAKEQKEKDQAGQQSGPAL